ncbi:hypothetical protein BBJ28_00003491 [Nothophytophthora sp. Chile5]|nr:hypothetical protein BBJ28_00003491 [Nothophytophthora sp. Chile5]
MRSMPPGDEDFILDESSVLAFLADCDMADDSTATPTVSTEASAQSTSDAIATWSDSASASSASTPESRPQQKKSWRQRRKEEVLHLREVVKQLSAKLDQLKLAAGVRSTLPDSEFAGVTTAPTFVLKAQAAHKTEAAAMWEKIAGRQSMHRQRSQEENASLHETLRHHMLRAKAMQRALRRRLRDEAMTTSLDVCKRYRFDGGAVVPPTNNGAVFDDLMAGMDEMYADMDHFFKRVKMHELPCPGRRNNTEKVRARGIFVEFLDCYAVPFGLRRTEKVIWTPPANASKDNRNIFHLTSGNNTQMKSVCFGITVTSIAVRIVVRKVLRKYVEPDRTVFIWRSLIEPMHDFISISFKETTRMVLTHGTPSATGPTTMMRSHREATAHDGHGSAFSNWQTVPSIDVGLDSWEHSITRFNQDVEDALMSESEMINPSSS